MGHYLDLLFNLGTSCYFWSSLFFREQLLFFSYTSGLQGSISLFFTIWCNSSYCLNTRWDSNFWIWFWSIYIRYTSIIWYLFSRKARAKGLFSDLSFEYTHLLFLKWMWWKHFSVLIYISLDGNNNILTLR